jgi:hypothetical protein
VEPGAGIALAGADHACDLRIGEPGEELERNQLALAAGERVDGLPQQRSINRRLARVRQLGWRLRIRLGREPRSTTQLIERRVRAIPKSQARGVPRLRSIWRRFRQARSKACEVTSSAAERSRNRPATYA